MSVFQIKILEPEATLFSGNITQATLPTINGLEAYLANHWDSTVALDVGIVTIILESGEISKYAINGGIATFANNTLTLNTIDAELIQGRKNDGSLFVKSFQAKEDHIEQEIQNALEQGGVFTPDMTLSALLAEERLAKMQFLNEMIKGI